MPGGRPRTRPRWRPPVVGALLGLATVVLAVSVAADVISFRAEDQYVWARLGHRIAAGGVAATIAAVALLLVGVRAAPATRHALRAALVLADVALLWFGAAFLVRRDDPLAPVGRLALVASALAVAALAAATLLAAATAPGPGADRPPRRWLGRGGRQ